MSRGSAASDQSPAGSQARLARSIGTDPGFDADLVHAALARALEVPGGASRLAPGAAFRPGISLPGDSSEMSRLLATLGRSPDWPS